MADTNLTMTCTKYEAILEDYLEGVLDETGTEEARRHLQTCAGCSAAFERAVGSVKLLRTAEPSEVPDSAFVRNVMARIRSTEQERIVERAGFWQPFVASGWRFAVSATLGVALLLTCDIGWSHYLRRNVASTGSVEGVELFAPEPAEPPASKDEVLMMVAETNHVKQ